MYSRSRLRNLRSQNGSTLVFVAVALVAVLSVAALALDVGHVYVVRTQLQNAADAAALSGASRLWPHSGSPVSTPQWSAAEAAASTTAPTNSADGSLLTQYEVRSGYWNLAHTPSGLQSQGITPGTNDAAAVEVIVRKSAGYNGGPVANWFAALFGRTTSDVSARATAVSASPGSMSPSALAPVAIAKEVADLYGDTTTTLILGSPYFYPNSLAGQWTSFLLDENSTTAVRGLIENGNPDTISVGDMIWILPGVHNTLYDNGNQPSIDHNYAGRTIILPIVDAVLSATTHAEARVVGFIGFHVDYATGGSTKTITGHFVQNVYTGLGGPAGPNYGIYVPPRLVQ